MADKTLRVTLSANDQMSAEFKKVGDASKTMGEAIEDSAKQASGNMKSMSADILELKSDMDTVGKTLSIVGAAGVAFFGVATRSSMDFTSAMANVQSIAQVSGAELESLRSTILDLASASGSMPTDLADGLYDIVGSGFEATDAVEVLTAATYAAGAGLTSTATAATAITAVLNAYGMSADQAGNVSDILFKVVDSGVISFETLAGAMGRTLPLAASLGISLDELGAGYAALTRKGFSGDMAETGLAALMTAALGPTEALKEAVKEYGYESTEALIKAEGFSGFLEFLQREAAGSSERMLALTGNTRANGAALALAADDGQVYIEMLKDMESAAKNGETTLKVFGIQMDNASGSVKMLAAEWAVATANIGSAIEPLISIGAGALDAVLSGFNALPGPAQAVATYLGAAASATTLFAGAAMLVVPKAVEFASALIRIRNAEITATMAANTRAIGANAIKLGAWGLAAGVAIGVAYKLWDAYKEGERVADNLAVAYANLQAIQNDMLLDGNMQAAEYVNNLNIAMKTLETIANNRAKDLPTIFPNILEMYEEQKGTGFADYRDFLFDLQSQMSINEEESRRLAAAQELLGNAFRDTRIDGAGLNEEINRLFDRYLRDATYTTDAFISDLESLAQNTSAYATNADTAADATDQWNTAMAEAAASASDLMAIFDRMPAMIDDLRLSGDFKLADDLEALNQHIVDAFAKREFLGLGAPGGELNGFIEIMNLTETQISTLDTAWNRAMTAMSSGVIDSTRYLADWNAILENSLLTDAEKVDALNVLSLSTYKYRDSTKAMQEGQLDFLKDGERILDWWREYDRMLSTSHTSEAFSGMVNWAVDIDDAGRALDQVLRTFQQIDDLGSRSSAAASIAERLVGEPGVWHDIDDMLQEGRINLEQYNATVSAGHDIQESNIRVQELLNDVRRQQLPLLRDEQIAYEKNLEYLSNLTPAEQRRALMLQDSSVQAEIATGFNLAYSASLGEIPEAVATEMILEKANADQGLKDIWLQMGLLTEDEFGIHVNFPEADATISAINRLTRAFIEMEAASRNMSGFELAVDIYGEEEALQIYGLVKNADGTYSRVTLAVETQGGEPVKQISDDLKDVTLADGTVVRVKTEIDTDDWDNLTAADLADRFDNDPVQLPVEAVIKPMDGVTPDEWNGMIGPFPNIEIPVTPKLIPADLQRFDEDPSQFGVSAISVPVTADTAQAQTTIETLGTDTTTTIEIVANDDSAAGMIATYQGMDQQSLANMYVWAIGRDESAAGMISGYNAREAESLANMYVWAIGNDDSASGMISAYQALDGTTLATTYVNVLTRSGSVSAYALGGTIGGYATGGVLFRAGEGNRPELAHFPSGGTALIPHDGIYAAPVGTYISPNNATGNVGAGVTVHVHVAGNVTTERELTHAIAKSISDEVVALGNERWGA